MHDKIMIKISGFESEGNNEVFQEVEGIAELNPDRVWVTEAAEGKEPEKEKERKEEKENEERRRRVRNLLKMSPETPESPIQPSPILTSPNRTKRNIIVDLSSDEGGKR